MPAGDTLSRNPTTGIAARYVRAASGRLAAECPRASTDFDCWLCYFHYSAKSRRMRIAQRKRTEDALRQSEMYSTKAQTVSRTGSFGWRVASGETGQRRLSEFLNATER